MKRIVRIRRRDGITQRYWLRRRSKKFASAGPDNIMISQMVTRGDPGGAITPDLTPDAYSIATIQSARGGAQARRVNLKRTLESYYDDYDELKTGGD